MGRKGLRGSNKKCQTLAVFGNHLLKKIVKYTFLGYALNSLLDLGMSLAYSETVKHIENGTLFEWLVRKFGDKLDLSIYNEDDKKAALKQFQVLLDVADSKGKFGVESSEPWDGLP